MRITLKEVKTLIKQTIEEEINKKVFTLYHVKSLSPSENEMVLVDENGNNVYIYKKEKNNSSLNNWCLYDTDTILAGNLYSGTIGIRPTQGYKMNETIVNVLPFGT